MRDSPIGAMLHTIRTRLDIPFSDMSADFGLPHNGLSVIERGLRLPDDSFIRSVQKRYGITQREYERWMHACEKALESNESYLDIPLAMSSPSPVSLGYIALLQLLDDADISRSELEEKTGTAFRVFRSVANGDAPDFMGIDDAVDALSTACGIKRDDKAKLREAFERSISTYTLDVSQVGGQKRADIIEIIESFPVLAPSNTVAMLKAVRKHKIPPKRGAKKKAKDITSIAYDDIQEILGSNRITKRKLEIQVAYRLDVLLTLANGDRMTLMAMDSLANSVADAISATDEERSKLVNDFRHSLQSVKADLSKQSLYSRANLLEVSESLLSVSDDGIAALLSIAKNRQRVLGTKKRPHRTHRQKGIGVLSKA